LCTDFDRSAKTRPWLTLALLGAYHGLNPAMGWLFAVALGLRERRRAAAIRAFAGCCLSADAAPAARDIADHNRS
jgi:hypothetical protein